MKDSSSGEWDVVHRVIHPGTGRADELPLYVRVEGFAEWTRDEIRLDAYGLASYDTYFATFPASYWVEATAIRILRLDMEVTGRARIVVRSSDAQGVEQLQASVDACDESSAIEVALTPAAGRLWFDVEAGDVGCTIQRPRWSVQARSRRERGSVVVGITTYNRVDECLENLRSIGSASELNGLVSEVVVVDQGSQKLRESEALAEVLSTSALPIRIVEQENLGGSGGFSRAMLEAEDREEASAVLLLDDDVRIEPESIRRLLAFSQCAAAPTIVGAQMLSLLEPSLLHTAGEIVDRSDFSWSPAVPSVVSRDVVRDPLSSAERSPFRPVDFNGWWMCLIPLRIVKELGFALPFFIKWDDTEYSLRASSHGYATVTLPGAAVWHMPWTAKDDGWDWQAYFQLRNRIVSALLYSPHARGGRLLSTTFAQEVNHVVGMQYGSAVLRVRAIRDILSGPEHLWNVLAAGPQGLTPCLAKYGQIASSRSARSVAPEPSMRSRPRGAIATALRAVKVLKHQLQRVVPPHEAADQSIPRGSAKWWSLGLVDSAVVSSADGATRFEFRRDRREAFRLLGHAAWLRARLWCRWRSVARRYRAVAGALASRDQWSITFSSGAPVCSGVTSTAAGDASLQESVRNPRRRSVL